MRIIQKQMQILYEMMKTTTEYVMLYVPHTEFGYLLLLKKVTVTKYSTGSSYFPKLTMCVGGAHL